MVCWLVSRKIIHLKARSSEILGHVGNVRVIEGALRLSACQCDVRLQIAFLNLDDDARLSTV
jgi:hypothetical protein